MADKVCPTTPRRVTLNHVAMGGVRQWADVSLSPPSASARSGQVALTCLRLLVGLMWLENVVWKVPPDFGERGRTGLYFWTHLSVEFQVFKPFSRVIEHVVLPNFTAFGWAVLMVESALAVLLLTGTAVRLAALLGIAQSIAIGLSVAEAPNEWPWAYAMMIGIHAVLLFAGGRGGRAVPVRLADRKNPSSSIIRVPMPHGSIPAVW